MEKYFGTIKNYLEKNLNLINIYSGLIDKVDAKAILFKNDVNKNKYNLNKDFDIKKSKFEMCKFETSIDSIRVSIKFKIMTNLDNLIYENIYQKLIKKYKNFDVIQKIPIENYDLTFLITDNHLEVYNKELLIEWVIKLISDIYKDLQNFKNSLSKLVKWKINLINDTVFSKHK